MSLSSSRFGVSWFIIDDFTLAIFELSEFNLFCWSTVFFNSTWRIDFIDINNGGWYLIFDTADLIFCIPTDLSLVKSVNENAVWMNIRINSFWNKIFLHESFDSILLGLKSDAMEAATQWIWTNLKILLKILPVKRCNRWLYF